MTKHKNKSDSPNDELIFSKLNQETGKINWAELQKHFAHGTVVVVEKDVDLVQVAQHFSGNQEKLIRELLDSEKMHRATDDDAKRWNNIKQNFWAVVVSPWVLVQEI